MCVLFSLGRGMWSQYALVWNIFPNLLANIFPNISWAAMENLKADVDSIKCTGDEVELLVSGAIMMIYEKQQWAYASWGVT